MVIGPAILSVKLYGKQVGTLVHLDSDRSIFAFDDDYLSMPGERRPTFGQAFHDAFGDIRSDSRTFRTRIAPFFSNMLPEGPLRDYLARRAEINPASEFFLLRALGADLPGAATVAAVEGENWPVESARGDLRSGSKSATDAPPLRFSLAGVQLKFPAAKSRQGGLAIPAEGANGSWIVKLPSSRFEGVPENEFSMNRLAILSGMDVPETDLVPIRDIGNLPDGLEKLGSHAFAIARFDRVPGGGRLHAEDFAQVLNVYPEEKYRAAGMAAVGGTLARIGSREDLAEFVRRVTFNMLIGNADAHLKNWSLVYPDRRNAVLSPAYDLVSTIPYISGDDTDVRIGRSRSFSLFTADELGRLAEKASIPRGLAMDAAKETVRRFLEAWSREARNLPMSAKVRESVEAHCATVPIAKEFR